MRILIAALIPVVLFGGVAAYINFTESVRPEPPVETVAIDTARYRVRVATTWPLVGDADYDTPALMISYRGRSLLESTQTVRPFEWREIEISEVARGENSLYVEVNWDGERDDSQPAFPPEFAAVRIQILRNDDVIAEQTLWRRDEASDQSGVIRFQSPIEQTSNPSDLKPDNGAGHD